MGYSRAMNIGNPIPSDPARRHLGRALVALALAFALAAPLAACGKRGDPMYPERNGQEFPKTYPDPKTNPPS